MVPSFFLDEVSNDQYIYRTYVIWILGPDPIGTRICAHGCLQTLLRGTISQGTVVVGYPYL